MVRSFRMAGAAIVLGTLAFGATGASAHGFHGGWGHGGFHGGWGHGWGYGGWGYRGIAFRPLYGACGVKRYVDIYGDLVVRRVCY